MHTHKNRNCNEGMITRYWLAVREGSDSTCIQPAGCKRELLAVSIPKWVERVPAVQVFR